MDITAVVALIAGAAVVVAAIVSGLFAITQLWVEHRVSEIRGARAYERDVLRFAQEPLLYAASDLQSRIWNIVAGGFLEAYGHSDVARHRVNSVEYTAFLFAQYFGWAEALRQGVMLQDMSARGKVGATGDSSVTGLIRKISDTLRTDDTGGQFMLFAGEQHAIGDLMFEWDVSSERRLPSVMRYEAFARLFRTDKAFRAWFAGVIEGLNHHDDPDASTRLRRLQNNLIDLIEKLDPNNRLYNKRTRLALTPEA